MDIAVKRTLPSRVKRSLLSASPQARFTPASTQPRNPTKEGPCCIAGVTFFDLSHLQPVASNDERGASRLVRDMVSTESIRHREAIVRERLEDLGFDWMGYYTAFRQPDGGQVRGFLSTFAPLDWSRRYFENRYYQIDPRNLKQRRSNLPLVWDLASLAGMTEQSPPCQRSQSFLCELDDSGMRSGIFQRMANPSAPAGEEVVVSLVSSEPSRRWIDDQVLGAALTLMLSLNHYLAEHARLPDDVFTGDDEISSLLLNGRLSAMQRTVLFHVAHGLTDREIAEKLSLSSHTVDYHLRQLRRRFEVHNRVQLVSAAAHLLGTS